MVSEKKIVIAVAMIALFCFGCWFFVRGVSVYQARASERALVDIQNQKIDEILDARRLHSLKDDDVDPFGDDGVVNILLIGLDVRIGQENGHCDAIQLISVDKNETGGVSITAVPRGTYSPLPFGVAATSTDYYVSNACGLGGLDYGIQQIENILGVKADYVVAVGFSETMGILKYLDLPSIETLQWLRNRHGYAIGEPQRAHNHSVFLKDVLIRFVSAKQTTFDMVMQHIMYNLFKTDLSFAQAQQILHVISDMDVAHHPKKIQLFMRPFYAVQDILYDPDHLSEYLNDTVGSISHLLSKDDYSNASKEEAQASLLDIIEKNMEDSEFVSWAYENSLWLQIEDNSESLTFHYEILTSYVLLLQDKEDRRIVLAEYMLEMENRGEDVWYEKGKELLLKEI